MKAVILLLLLTLLEISASAALVIDHLVDSTGSSIDREIKIYPVSTPQTFTFNGTNVTVMDVQRTVKSTNGFWFITLVGGYYLADFGTINNGFKTPQQLFLVPPYDTNTYDWNYLANLATNIGTFVWTNTYGLQSGTNISFRTNGPLLIIDSTASGGGGGSSTNLYWNTTTNFVGAKKLSILYVYTNGVPWYGIFSTNN